MLYRLQSESTNAAHLRWVALIFVALVSISIHVRADEPAADGHDTKSLRNDQRHKVVEDAYEASLKKAADDHQRAKAAAAKRLLTHYRDHLKTATKAGDFDKATAIKARILELESNAGMKLTARPQDAVKFQKRTYALIKTPASWTAAKRKCEEMGGRLVCIRTDAERVFVMRMCVAAKVTAWVGASDEATEGDWRWLTGDKVLLKIETSGGRGENCLCAYSPTESWHDNSDGAPLPYICEWDN